MALELLMPLIKGKGSMAHNECPAICARMKDDATMLLL